MTNLQTLDTALKQNHFSLTKARQAVFRALEGTEPLSMSELIARTHPYNRASVYRTVALFEQLGIVQRLQTGWKYKLELTQHFDDHHHHATCLVCGVSLIIPGSQIIENQLSSLAKGLGFQLTRHQLELQGYCQACQALLKD